MALRADALQQLNNARAWCRKIARPFRHLNLPFAFETRRQKSGKLIVGYLESAYQKMWRLFREDQPPQQFEVAAD